MEEEIQILIENFNLTKSTYEFGRQEIVNKSIHEIKDILLLESFPPKEKYPTFPACIITKDRIFTKKNNKICEYDYNYKFEIFGLPTRNNIKNFDIINFEAFIKDKEQEKNKERKSINIRNKIILIEISCLPFIFVVIYLLLFFLRPDLNLFLVTLWSTFLLIYLIQDHIRKIKDESEKIPIEYSLQILRGKPINLTTMIILQVLMSFTMFHFIYFNYYENRTFGIFMLGMLIADLFIITGFLYLLNYHFRTKLAHKRSMQKKLAELIHSKGVGDWLLKEFLLTCILEINKKPVIKVGIFSKFVLLLSLIISFVPYITAMII